MQALLGVGVTVKMLPNTSIAKWGLKERSSRNKTIDEVVAIKQVFVQSNGTLVE